VGRIWKSSGTPGQSDNFTATVPVLKSYEHHKVKTQLFTCLPPACFETGFGFVSGFEEDYNVVREFIPKKSKKWRSYGGGNVYSL
jgi:hypothetical protein